MMKTDKVGDVLTHNKFQPQPEHWTLRFKHAKSTIFLHVGSEQPFADIKKDLVSAISKLPAESQIVQSLGGAVPADPDDIVFGVPVDRLDLSLGWVRLDFEDEGGDGEDGDVKDEDEDDQADAKKGRGKRKVPAKRGVDPDAVQNRNPRSAGLKDGRVLAFAVRSFHGIPESGSDWGVEVPQLLDDEPEEGDEDKEMDEDVNG